jgi:hypothetical protein
MITILILVKSAASLVTQRQKIYNIAIACQFTRLCVNELKQGMNTQAHTTQSPRPMEYWGGMFSMIDN